MFSKKNRNRNFKEPKYFSLERFFFSTTDVSSLHHLVQYQVLLILPFHFIIKIYSEN